MSPNKGVFFYATFDLSALLSLAEHLRQSPCSCDESKRPESGALNWAITLLFKDGAEWIFRSPRKCHDISPETIARVLESEVATMKYVKLNSSIPVPEVFDYRYRHSSACRTIITDHHQSCTGFNTIGIPFILMSKAPGFALRNFAWNPSPKGIVSSRKPRPGLKRINKEKIMKQLGEICSQLLNLRFNEIGSLFEEDGEYRIKKCLSPPLVWHERDSLSDNDVPRGPFQNAHDYYKSLLSAFLLHVKELPLEQHAFFAPIPELREFETLASYQSAVSRWNDFVAVGSKIDSSKNRLDYCIAGHFLHNMIPLISQQTPAIFSDFANGYPLCHPDLSTSNIFVDCDFNITCIIDWAFSSTVPISALLVTPGLPHPRDEADTTLAPTFRASFIQHFLQGKDFKLNAEFWDHTRIAWLFLRLVTLDSLQDYRYFTELHSLVYKQKEDIDVPRLFNNVRKEEEFIKLAATLAEDDRSAEEIKKK
ncbi:hypothetical protein G7Y89_g7225 [Cudoniella acicularis]|uniref:Aminoglycoside phosphotransferase domain-containing protein n=1 Tax=Cudoniella acicularis TaxID=354080 RepID=A0A8H4RJR5_9HELO|nr:hypothetical protein G7Y89_g7225 [Cudoniella acicularis]